MEIFRDQSYTFEERAADLASRMTLEEKITQVGAWTAPIPRLGIPAFHYANEASHGISALDYVNPNVYDVTSYPVCLAMSQSWDREKMEKVSAAISDEARVYHNLKGESLSFFCPTINLNRDPRNGRSDENFGEDPCLAGKMAASYIKGFQGEDAKYVKAVASPKHYMMNSSENNRGFGSSNADEATVREYYAKVFEYAVREGRAQSLMISYNRVNGVPSAVNSFMLDTLLREEWGFDGYVVSDCGAIAMTYAQPSAGAGSSEGIAHYYCKDEEEASAAALIAGTDLSCGSEHRKHLKKALDRGLIDEGVIDRAVIRNLTSLFRLGIFDRPEDVPYSGLGPEDASNAYTHGLSVDMANDTIVLLKNEKKLLPLQTDDMKKLLVVGPTAKFRQLGGYSCGGMGGLDTPVNIMALDGIRNILAQTGVEVLYEKGWCTQKERITLGNESVMATMPDLDLGAAFANMMGEAPAPEVMQAVLKHENRHRTEDPDCCADDEVLFERALRAAKTADVVVLVAGTDEGTASEGCDRTSLELPGGQNDRIKRILEVNPKTVVVLMTLGPVTGDCLDRAHTLVNAHFAGEAQGTALANVLFGKVNPNAKLSNTWYKNLEDLPPINDYGLKKQDTLNLKSRTYLYFDGKVRFPFGYGLSYTQFDYGNLRLEKERLAAGDALTVQVDVTNSGSRPGKEIVELYLRKVNRKKLGDNKPFRQLKEFAKIALEPGETRTVTLTVQPAELTFWSNFRHRMVIEEGEYAAEIGRSSADIACSACFTMEGEWEAPLTTVYVDIDRYIYHIGEEGRMKVSATLADTTHLSAEDFRPSYESSDPSVASVDADGVVTALSSGTASITASVCRLGRTLSRSLPVAVR